MEITLLLFFQINENEMDGGNIDYKFEKINNKTFTSKSIFSVLIEVK